MPNYRLCMHEVFHLGVGLCTKWIIPQSSLVSATPPDLRTLHWQWKCDGLSTACPVSWQYYASWQAYECYTPAVTWEHRPHEALGWLLWNTKAFGTTGTFRLLDVALTLSVWRCLLGSFFFLNDHHTLSRRVVRWCWNPFPQMDQHVTRSSKHCTASVLDCTSPKGLGLPISAVRLRRGLLQTAVVGVLV